MGHDDGDYASHMLGKLEGYTLELGRCYRPPSWMSGDPDSALLDRLRIVEERTSQPVPERGEHHSIPRSRPPSSLEHVSWYVKILTDLRDLGASLSMSGRAQFWRTELLNLPYTAANTSIDTLTEVTATVSRWHGTCLTVLGYREPGTPIARYCRVCGATPLMARGDAGTIHAWCTNPDCVDPDTGRPAVYRSGFELLQCVPA